MNQNERTLREVGKNEVQNERDGVSQGVILCGNKEHRTSLTRDILIAKDLHRFREILDK